MLTRREFYINGRWTAPHATHDYTVIDPSTEDPCAIISLGSQADTDTAGEQHLAGVSIRSPRESAAHEENGFGAFAQDRERNGRQQRPRFACAFLH